ncbi:MAG: phosphatase PAP2 family protein [Actinobacteria bacterium]|nr:phosphatase PAP2 family protein [Actinomycetota bacterium]MBO0834051.1 phosphatase PAP2 family protein [Actinomycetota bacterium]
MINRQRLVPLALRFPAQHQPPSPLLPAPARPPAAIAAAICLVIVALLAIASVHQDHGFPVDRAVESWLVGLHIPERGMSLFSRIGGGLVATALTAALALACLIRRRLSAAVLTVAGVALASALTEYVLKPSIHRTINGALVYPSGHATGLFALATAVAIILLAPRTGRPPHALRYAAVALATAVATAVGLAMVALGYHYFTDTIGGAALGTGVMLATALVLDLEVVRRQLGMTSDCA